MGRGRGGDTKVATGYHRKVMSQEGESGLRAVCDLTDYYHRCHRCSAGQSCVLHRGAALESGGLRF